MEKIQNLIFLINSYVWGNFLIFLLVGTGLFLTIRFRFIQISFFKHAVSLISGKWDNPNDDGEINHFQALATALSATIGTGNIAGVATAIASGGPGAMFWMWVTALVGMASKFTCCSLSQLYRKIEPDGSISGGPMYYLKYGLKLPFLGFLFALFTVVASFGIGNMVQANSVANPLYDNLGISKIMIGIIIAILVGAVIIKGIKRIAKVASMIVPFMTVFYLLGSLIVLFIYRDRLLDSFLLIFQSAFGFKEIGGGVLGYSVSRAMQFGIARGIFSNESGLGSAAIAHAPAKTKEPVREGFVAMLGPFIDTIVICSLTGLVIISSGVYGSGMTGASLTAAAFESVLPNLGKYIVSIGIIFFAFSTIIAWSYYGETGVKYLFPNSKNKMVNIYRWVYVLVIPIGAIFNLETIWAIADIANALMAFPNLIALLFLSGVVSIKLKDYKNRYKFMKPYK